ncbi:hypothetical protein JOB18_049713 [Solea senegalensis]|uniref:Uncharacterized protein n=1 Tax=Solea senegalensis TaxID=28829 RepID=A0AAV6RJ51_SOLSE|nr:hypothetical protein JOB18_049713 [Solea senegalensis]
MPSDVNCDIFSESEVLNKSISNLLQLTLSCGLSGFVLSEYQAITTRPSPQETKMTIMSRRMDTERTPGA